MKTLKKKKTQGNEITASAQLDPPAQEKQAKVLLTRTSQLNPDPAAITSLHFSPTWAVHLAFCTFAIVTIVPIVPESLDQAALAFTGRAESSSLHAELISSELSKLPATRQLFSSPRFAAPRVALVGGWGDSPAPRPGLARAHCDCWQRLDPYLIWRNLIEHNLVTWAKIAFE